MTIPNDQESQFNNPWDSSEVRENDLGKRSAIARAVGDCVKVYAPFVSKAPQRCTESSSISRKMIGLSEGEPGYGTAPKVTVRTREGERVSG